MLDDTDLLHRYATRGDEDAFRELVQRRFGLVYAVALRQVGGDEHLARDVAQHAFHELARQGNLLSGRQVISGWLYRTARFTAIDVVRAERRRRTREETAHFMHESSTDGFSDADWKNLRPLLDEVLSELKTRDRDAILLRVIEDRSFVEIGRVLRLTENAARMCVERAFDRLRQRLRRHGVTSTTAALTLALANQATAAVPSGLPALVAGEALAGAKLGATVASVGFMSTTKTLLVAALAATAIGIGIYQAREARQADDNSTALSHDIAALRARQVRLQRQPQISAWPPSNQSSPNAAASSGAAAVTVDAVTADEVARMNAAYESNRNVRVSSPEYQLLFERATRASAHLDYVTLYKTLRLTPAQIDAFETLIAKHMLSQVDRDGATSALGLKWTDLTVAEFEARAERDFHDRLKALLGPEGYPQFQQAEDLTTVRGLVNDIAGEVYLSDAPLTAAQGTQLTDIIARHNPNLHRPGELWTLESVDWNSVLAETKPLLAPGQFTALRGAVASTQRRTEDFRLLNQIRGNQQP